MQRTALLAAPDAETGTDIGEAKMISAGGALCSECPAYLGATKGIEHQKRTIEAWHNIYGLNEKVEHVSCGRCLGPDDKVFHASRSCKAGRCYRSKEFSSSAECPKESCEDLERAQSVWDEVPALVKKLSPADFAVDARPYCGHRKRLSEARAALGNW